MDKIKIELCGGRMLEKAHSADAAYDVFTSKDFDIKDWERYAVPLGFKMQLPVHLAALLQSRSGMTRYGIPVIVEYYSGEKKEERVDADIELGLVDSGYTGEVSALLKTFSIDVLGVKRVYIPKGTKIAQMRIVEIPRTELEESVIDKDTERGERGYNSTGF